MTRYPGQNSTAPDRMVGAHQSSLPGAQPGKDERHQLNLAVIGMPETLYLGREGSEVRSAQAPYGESLSERELQVLRLMACGATNHAIAEQLVITVGTVKSHINHIFGKLDAHNRTEAVARARGLGLIEI